MYRWPVFPTVEEAAAQFDRVAESFRLLGRSLEDTSESWAELNRELLRMEAEMRAELTPPQRDIYDELRSRGVYVFDAHKAARIAWPKSRDRRP
jgi:hypothetical protein